ncbi:nitrogenase FeMo-cofactor scaffold and assembly protein NifN [Klebsiella michiganensis]|nr:nitrogenase FeMo-cofactor scaffold and assembly protein NifN [Klebsiella michiganensis]
MQPGPLVAPTGHPSLRQLPVERVVPGDLEDLQTLLCAQPADLLVANSHACDPGGAVCAAAGARGFSDL